VRPAAAETVVTTIHVPAQVETNPCFPADVINLNAHITIVVNTTADGSGVTALSTCEQQAQGCQYHHRHQVREQRQADRRVDRAAAVPGDPHPHLRLPPDQQVSNVPNYVLHMTMHETIDPNGVPTVVVDNFYMDCQG